MHRRTLLAAALCTTFAAAPAWSQQGTTRIVVPFAAGGPIDVTARVLAEQVRGSLGNVIVENRPGGGGNIGVDAVAKAAPDGLTLGCRTTRRRTSHRSRRCCACPTSS